MGKVSTTLPATYYGEADEILDKLLGVAKMWLFCFDS